MAALVTAEDLNKQLFGQRCRLAQMATLFERELVGSIWAPMMAAIGEVRPHVVHHVDGQTVYVKPDSVFWKAARGPTDCVWIVPGTLTK